MSKISPMTHGRLRLPLAPVSAAHAGLVRNLARLAAHIDLRWLRSDAPCPGVEQYRARLCSSAYAIMILPGPEGSRPPFLEDGVYISAHAGAWEPGAARSCEMNIEFMLPGSDRATQIRAGAELKSRFLHEILKRVEAGADWSCLAEGVPIDDAEAFATTLSQILGFRPPARVGFAEALAQILTRG
uniref:Uncharacterized protein n=1 Tax=Cereibacter sphaeroides (strain ATCC 17025 / ATH 2.4.3) TaxID=349102 RepID=A4X070_CERS5